MLDKSSSVLLLPFVFDRAGGIAAREELGVFGVAGVSSFSSSDPNSFGNRPKSFGKRPGLMGNGAWRSCIWGVMSVGKV